MVKKLPKVDVVTTGMGWTGGIVSAELTKAGFKVVGLERGEERTTEDYLHGHDEVKYTVHKELMHKLNKDTITFRNNLNEVAKPVRNIASLTIGEGTGGGGAHWGAQTHRYYPYDFEIRTLTEKKYGKKKIPKDMLIQDWGITYDELEPYYVKFEEMAGISGEVDPLAGKRSKDYPNPPMRKTPSMKLFQKACEDLGYHPYTVPTGNISQMYKNPDGEQLNACQYCSFCGNYGCEYGAKADPIVTVIPTAKKTGNFELRTNSEVTRVLYENGKATGVRYRDTRTGVEYEQPADLVVLTSYTFNNVRLLLLSGIGTPYNPKTGTGVIGKNYCDHHTIMGATGFFEDEKFNLFIGTGALGMACSDFTVDNFDHTNVDFIHGGQLEMHQFGNEPISNNAVPMGTPTWGKEFKKASLKYTNRQVSVVAQRGIMPWKEHYLDLDPNYKDAYGDPLIRATFDYTDQDRNLNEFLVEKCAGVLEKMGASIIDKHVMPEHFGGSFTYQHDAGGAIMGNDPKTSAVNKYLQMWDCENLFVCGASAFPHFGTTNPTTTLGALTYHATEGMIKYLKKGGQLVK